MSNTVIQIKRSTTTGVPTSLQPGELAYTSNGEVLFIGSAVGSDVANVVPIAGKRYPGTLTANQALVANNSSWIDKVQTAKLIIGAAGETINVQSVNTSSNSTSLGAGSNTELATTYAIKNYVDLKTAAVGGAIGDTQISFSNNGVLTGNAAFTFNDDTLVVTVANAISVGSNVTISNSSITVGNATVNSVITQTTISTTGNVSVNGFITSGNVNITGTANVSSDINVGANTKITTSTISVGNTTVNATINSTSISVTGTLHANGAATLSNTLTVSGLANLASANIVGALAVGGDTTIAGNLTVTVDTSLNGNVSLGNGTGDRVYINGYVNTAVIPAVNSAFDLGSNNNAWGYVHANNLHGTYLNIDADATISGNLVVSGSLVSINVSTLSVTDPLIELAKDNLTTDTLDIGFHGSYKGVGDLVTKHAGLFRDSTDGVFKIFTNLDDLPTTTVNTAGAGYALATLETFLNSGILTTSNNSLVISANSTSSANIYANTITISNALEVTSGGTGLNSITNNAILVGNTAGTLTMVSSSTEGHVLQINSSGAPTFSTLDGGTF